MLKKKSSLEEVKKKPKRVVVSISTMPEKLAEIDELVAGLDAKASAHIDRSRMIAALFDVLQNNKKYIRAERIVDKATLRDELARALGRDAIKRASGKIRSK